MDISKLSDAEILARTAWGENRGGGGPGMQSVLNVIMNRARKPSWWGTSPRDVCLKKDQFDCWNENDPNFKKILTVDMTDGAYIEATKMAYQALAGTLEDITGGSCYYFAQSLHPWPIWARGKQPFAAVAGQLFFNNIA